jgi:hypothetical protein
MPRIFDKLVGDLLASKKFKTIVVGAISALAVRVGLDGLIGPEEAMQMAEYIAGMFTSGAFFQGLADLGKERAKVEADAALKLEGGTNEALHKYDPNTVQNIKESQAHALDIQVRLEEMLAADKPPRKAKVKALKLLQEAELLRLESWLLAEEAKKTDKDEEVEEAPEEEPMVEDEVVEGDTATTLPPTTTDAAAAEVTDGE